MTERVVVRSRGAPGKSAKQVALRVDPLPDGLPANATDAEFATWLQKPATDAAAEGTGAIITARDEALAAIGEDDASGARGAALTALEAARAAILDAGGELPVAQQAALDAIAAAEAAILDPGGTLPVAQQAALDAIEAARAAILDAGGELPVALAAALAAIGEDDSSGARGAAIDAVAAAGTVQTDAIAGAGQVQTDGIAVAGQAQLNAIALAAAGANHIYTTTAAALADGTLAVNSYFLLLASAGQMILYQKLSGPTLSGALFTYVSGADPVTRMRMAQAQYDSQVSQGLRAYPTMYPMRMYMGTRTGGAAKNSDGTYHMPAASTWKSAQINYDPFISAGNRYLYIVLCTPTADAITVAIKHGGSTIASTMTQPAPGIYKVTWTNTAFTDYIEVLVTAVVDCDVRPFELYGSDSAYLPQIIRYDEVIDVPENRTVIDWDKISPMSRFGSVPIVTDYIERALTVAYDSVNGASGNAGTAWAPKKDIDTHGTATNGEVIGFKAGSYWNASLTGLTGAGNAAKGVMLIGYTDNEPYTPWPKIDGGRALDDRTWTADTTAGIWYCDAVACESALIAADGYSFSTVVAHKTADETAMPLGCEFVLKPFSSLAALRADTGTSGSFADKPTSTTVRWYVKTPDGLQPGMGGYTYRGCTKYCPVNWDATNVRSGYAANLIVTQGGFGYGGYSGGPKNLTNGLVAAHGWTHTFKFEAGEARDLVLYGRGSTGNTGNCYIGISANGYSWAWRNVVGFSCQTLIYSHCASGQYTHGEISYCWDYGARDTATGGLVPSDSYAVDYAATVLDEWNLSRGKMTDGRAGSYTDPVNCEMRNKLIPSTGVFRARTNTHDCVVVIENISDPSSVNNRNSVCIQVEQGFVVSNCLIYARNIDVSGYPAGLSDYTTEIYKVLNNAGLNNPQIVNNIIVVETHLAASCSIYNEAASGMVFTSNNNIIVICPPGNITSSKIGVGTKTTWAQYLAMYSGHDTTTWLEDRRDDPRRAGAVFMNPSALDLRWAQTDVAQRLKALSISMGAGPWWTIKGPPTQDLTVDRAIYRLTGSHY